MVNLPMNFVHLSDIHFGAPVLLGPHDLNGPLRLALERDLGEMRNKIGTMTGIFVTGDIAYSGESEQYREATTWLATLCSTIGCAEEDVWTTPGNHDIQRAKVAGSKIVRDFHERVRNQGASRLDTELREALLDGTYGKALFEPLASYNSFALKFGCSVTPEEPFWKDDILLNDGSTLRLLGLNSTLISDSHDDDGAHKLALGAAQLNIASEAGVENLVLCHHPPQWLIDADAVEIKLKALVRVQLFGHKHAQVVDKINETVRLVSGAVHPHCAEREWTPRYNLISLYVEGTGEERFLKVKIFLRVWSKAHQKFVADATLSESLDGALEYNLKLRAWRAPAAPFTHPTAVAATPNAFAVPAPMQAAITDPRTLTYRLMSLSLVKIMEVAEKMGLLEGRDLGSTDYRFFSDAVKLLEKDARLAECWDAINEIEGSNEPNPYRPQADLRSVNA
ncbi:MAG: metallophosphoesterase [Elusimicrobiota bacterium]|nr:metallophosphoesterase [Elusimicrobiota bacterium]